MAALAKSSLAGSCCVDARDNPEAQAGEVRSGVRRPIARASVSDTQPWQPTLTSPLSMIQLNKTHRIPVVVCCFFVFCFRSRDAECMQQHLSYMYVYHQSSDHLPPRMRAASSPRTPMSLMFTFDGEEGDELCLCLESTRAPSLEDEGASCHRYTPISSLLGPGSEARLASTQRARLEQHDAGQAKVAQLLIQWLALPTTETLLSLIQSNVRRSLPIARDIVFERGVTARTSLPLAPMRVQKRWSVSGGTPRQPPLASPGTAGTPRLQRRKSEPTLPTIAFATPPGNSRLSFDAIATATTAAGTPRRASVLLSPGSEARGVELVHSPLSYFGTQPDVAARFLQVPQGDGGLQVMRFSSSHHLLPPHCLSPHPEHSPSRNLLFHVPNTVTACGLLPPQAFFDDAAGGSAGSTLSAAELLRLTVEKLDLPRAVGRLVVKRAMQARTRAPPPSHAALPEARLTTQAPRTKRAGHRPVATSPPPFQFAGRLASPALADAVLAEARRDGRQRGRSGQRRVRHGEGS